MTRAERIILFVESYCRVPEGALVGTRLELEPFQKDFIRAIYDNPHGTKKAYLSIARKNGKSALTACLLLAHLLGPEAKQNSQLVTGAMSRDQAALIFNLAAKMIRLNPDLQDITRIVDSQKRIFGLPMSVEFRALAAEGKTAHGLSPVLAILDEVGQSRGSKSEFIDAITTSQGAHKDPLLIAISTQAADNADLFSVWLDDAEKSGDPRIVSHVYAAPEDCDIEDETAWHAANPALGRFRSLDDVRQMAAEAKRMPSAENTFRNLILNQRVSTASPFMSRLTWELNGTTPAATLSGMEVFAGLDLSARKDLTALVMIGRDQAGNWHIHPTFWTPEATLLDRARRDRVPYDVWKQQGFLRTTPGKTVDYEQVAREIAEIVDGLDVSAIAFDRWRMDVLKAEFDRIGATLPLAEHGQGYKDMSPSLDEFEAVFLNGKARHGMHPVLTMCAAGAVVTKDPAGNRKLDKSKATARIDGLVALAMAFGASLKRVEAEAQPTYEMFFL